MKFNMIENEISSNIAQTLFRLPKYAKKYLYRVPFPSTQSIFDQTVTLIFEDSYESVCNFTCGIISVFNSKINIEELRHILNSYTNSTYHLGVKIYNIDIKNIVKYLVRRYKLKPSNTFERNFGIYSDYIKFEKGDSISDFWDAYSTYGCPNKLILHPNNEYSTESIYNMLLDTKSSKNSKDEIQILFPNMKLMILW